MNRYQMKRKILLCEFGGSVINVIDQQEQN